MESFLSRFKRWHFAFVLILVQVISHFAYLKLPAVGNHVWRQCNTLAVARNYYQEDMDILYPRIDKRYHSNGITGPQFTSYDYTLALVYKAFGFSQNAHRYLSLIRGIFAILGMFYLAHYYFQSDFLAFLCSLGLIGIPEFYYHSINAVPDLLALAAMIWGWFGFQKYMKRPSLKWALFTVLLMTLAGMTKIMFLIPGFVFLGEIMQQKIYRKLAIIPILIMGLVVISASLGWYYWAKILTSMNGIYEFVHEVRFIEGWGNRAITLLDNVFKDIPETKTKAYWQGVKEAKRRMPGTKGKEVLYASWPDYGAEMDYVTSRKKVYVPLYHEMMIHTESAEMHKQRVENGINVVIYDFDGPRLEDGSVTCLEVTEELLREKINDVRFPFGHGYIVAAHLAGISLDKFIAA